MGGEARREWLSPSCLVALQSFGLVLAGRGRHGQVNLVAAELVLLGLLTVQARLTSTDDAAGQIAERVPAQRDRLESFVAQLRERRLLLDGEVELPPSAPSATTPTGLVRVPIDQPLTVVAPLVFRPVVGGFALHDHDGVQRIHLTGGELAAVASFCTPSDTSAAWASHRDHAGPLALDEESFEALVRRLVAADVVRPADGLDALDEVGAEGRLRREMQRMALLARTIDADVDRRRTLEQERRAATGTARHNVVPVQHNGALVPLALGMLVAFAKAFEDGRLEEHFHFLPQWVIDEARVRVLLEDDGPAVFLFSNYDWSHDANLDLSRLIKELSPGSVTIHGGPDTPKYPADIERYFAANPHVDVAVHGEGEVTCAEALAALVGGMATEHQGRSHLGSLADVAGLTFRTDDGPATTESRDRISDLDTIPSPFLTGLFSAYDRSTAFLAVIETNRGCPYGCTYCDWGSSTLSRIRKFSLDRVVAELEWCAERGNDILLLADANFGIFERDVEIAQAVARLKNRYDSPKVFVTNYAKNTVKHLATIVSTMVDAGILAEGLLSLQTHDAETLATVKRSNIKLEKYDQLANEFRQAGLPLYIDLMLGLPGSTVASFSNDLQECIDREVTGKVFPTQMLVNSPMNEPAHRTEHRIEIAGDAVKTAGLRGVQPLVVASESFTRADYERMNELRLVYVLAENFGVLRQVMRFVRQETGMREIDFLVDLFDVARDDQQSWPAIAYTFESVPKLMAPPASWRLFIDEVHTYLVGRLGLSDDSALETVLAVQHALLPAVDRTFPVCLELAHDFASWHGAMIDAKVRGLTDSWPGLVPRLGELGPGAFEVVDPAEVCAHGLGFGLDFVDVYENWELGSPVRRAMVSHRGSF
jgi:hypothetical protein